MEIKKKLILSEPFVKLKGEELLQQELALQNKLRIQIKELQTSIEKLKENRVVKHISIHQLFYTHSSVSNEQTTLSTSHAVKVTADQQKRVVSVPTNRLHKKMKCIRDLVMEQRKHISAICPHSSCAEMKLVKSQEALARLVPSLVSLPVNTIVPREFLDLWDNIFSVHLDVWCSQYDDVNTASISSPDKRPRVNWTQLRGNMKSAHYQLWLEVCSGQLCQTAAHHSL